MSYSEQQKPKLNEITKTLHQLITKEDLYVSVLEELCYSLRDAIIDQSLKFPELKSFERYLGRLNEYENIVYIIELMHKCWLYVHPKYMFDTELKSIEQGEILRMALKKFNNTDTPSEYDFVKEELNRGNMLAYISYYKTYHQRSDQIKLIYTEYMNGLHHIAKAACQRKSITMSKSFIIDSYFDTDLSYDQLVKVFDAVANEGYIDNKESNRKNFLSMFQTTIIAKDAMITWKDRVSQNNSPNYATLYILFKTLGVDMSKQNRTIICVHFVDCDGKVIMENQLKQRKSNHLEKLKQTILSVL